MGYPGRGLHLFLEAWKVLDQRGCKARALLVGPCVGNRVRRKDLWDWATARGMRDRLEIREAIQTGNEQLDEERVETV